jgi:hypothetical protein
MTLGKKAKSRTEATGDGDGETYLSQLKNRFMLSIEYEQIIL